MPPSKSLSVAVSCCRPINSEGRVDNLLIMNSEGRVDNLLIINSEGRVDNLLIINSEGRVHHAGLLLVLGWRVCVRKSHTGCKGYTGCKILHAFSPFDLLTPAPCSRHGSIIVV